MKSVLFKRGPLSVKVGGSILVLAGDKALLRFYPRKKQVEQNTPQATPSMNETQTPERSYWPAWSGLLRQWGLDGAAGALLEASGPLSLLLAQVVYIGQPFLGGREPGGQLQAFSRLLENPLEAQAFAAYLREEEMR